jgi:N-acetylglucosamine kinase-like BadF-type ATPase
MAGGGAPLPTVLAVDGGASKTSVVLVAVDGTVVGSARGPASNHQMVGLSTAMDNLGATIDAALADADLLAHLGGTPVCPVGIYCLAGLDLAVDEQRVGDAVRARRWSDSCDLRNDTFAVLRAGVTAGWGIGVVCGTGLNCVAIAPDGASVRFPALGELSGDFAPGGAWLGVRGLGLALRAGDGRGEPTVLRDLVPAHLGLESPEAALEAVYTGVVPFGRLVELAEVVLGAADDGDGPAVEAVDLLAAEAAAMVRAAVRRLGLDEGAGGAGGDGRGGVPVEIVVGGGIFANARFEGLVLTGVRRHVPGAVLRPLGGRQPVLGAALLGLDALAAGPEAEASLRATMVRAE